MIQRAAWVHDLLCALPLGTTHRLTSARFRATLITLRAGRILLPARVKNYLLANLRG